MIAKICASGVLAALVVVYPALASVSKDRSPDCYPNRLECLAAPSSAMSVHPNEAAQLKPVELSTLVAEMIPYRWSKTTGAGITSAVGWDYHADDLRIRWVTQGYESDELDRDQLVRRGLVRIRVRGRFSTVLRIKSEELAWSVSLATKGNPNFGPEYIRIEPGAWNSQEDCFGTLYSGCEFDSASALSSPQLHFSRLRCPRQIPEVYRVTVQGKAPSILVYSFEGGSGGGSNWLEIHPDTSDTAELKKFCSFEL